MSLRLQGRAVLLLDGGEPAAHSAFEVLRRHGAQIWRVSDVNLACEVLERCTPDLALLTEWMDRCRENDVRDRLVRARVPYWVVPVDSSRESIERDLAPALAG